MDDTEDDARYPPNPSSSTYHASNYPNHRRPKLPVRNPSSAHHIYKSYYNEDDEEEEEEEDKYSKRRKYHNKSNTKSTNDDEDEEEEDDDDDDDGNVIHRAVRAADEDEEDDDDDDEDDDDDDDDVSGRYRRAGSSDDVGPRGKRPIDRFEFAPRVKPPPAPPAAPAASTKPSLTGPRGSPIADWSESSTFVLLDAWGDRFLQLGRKSLRSEDWLDVAKLVSQASRAVRTDAQCRNRLDTLKKKYKKEKMRVSESGNGASDWVYFKKMEELMAESPPPRQQPGLACGVDSGEYVFMNPKVYLSRSTGLDELRDSPGNSEDGVEDSDELPPKRARLEGGDEGGGPSSFRMLADSIQKFGEIYEKMENSKRQQMMELEKMRMEFHRDLEQQKRQILERAQAEIAKIRQGDDDEENEVSIENVSG